MQMIYRVNYVPILAMGLLAILFIFDVDDSGATENWISEDIPSEAQKLLAADYVLATRSRDLEALRRLYYGPSLFCRYYQDLMQIFPMIMN